MILRKKEVCRRVGLSPVTIWRMEREGNFPPRVQLSKRAVGWDEKKISRWLDERPGPNGQGVKK